MQGLLGHIASLQCGELKSSWPAIMPCGVGPIRCEVVTQSCPRTRISRDHDHANSTAVIQPVGTAPVVTGKGNSHRIPVGITLGGCGRCIMLHILCRGSLDKLSPRSVGTSQVIVASYPAMWHGAQRCDMISPSYLVGYASCDIGTVLVPQ